MCSKPSFRGDRSDRPETFSRPAAAYESVGESYEPISPGPDFSGVPVGTHHVVIARQTTPAV